MSEILKETKTCNDLVVLSDDNLRTVYKNKSKFLHLLRRFMKNQSIKTTYQVLGKPVDLFRLYLSVRERGGFFLTTLRKLWPAVVVTILEIGEDAKDYSKPSFLIRRVYSRCLLRWECHFERGGIDLQLVLEQLEIFNSKQRNSSFTNEKVFLVHLESFLKQKGRPITTDALQLSNLFQLYHSVRDLGGFVAVTQSKFWPRLSLELMGKVSSDLILCKLYVNNLLDWECEFDRGGLDAKSVLQQIGYSFLLEDAAYSHSSSSDDSCSTISMDDLVSSQQDYNMAESDFPEDFNFQEVFNSNELDLVQSAQKQSLYTAEFEIYSLGECSNDETTAQLHNNTCYDQSSSDDQNAFPFYSLPLADQQSNNKLPLPSFHLAFPNAPRNFDHLENNSPSSYWPLETFADNQLIDPDRHTFPPSLEPIVNGISMSQPVREFHFDLWDSTGYPNQTVLDFENFDIPA